MADELAVKEKHFSNVSRALKRKVFAWCVIERIFHHKALNEKTKIPLTATYCDLLSVAI